MTTKKETVPTKNQNKNQKEVSSAKANVEPKKIKIRKKVSLNLRKS